MRRLPGADIISYKLEHCRRLWMNSWSSKPSAEAVTLRTTWERSLTHHPVSSCSLQSRRFSMEARYSFKHPSSAESVQTAFYFCLSPPSADARLFLEWTRVCFFLHLCGFCVQSLQECESTSTVPVEGCVSSLLLLISSAVKLVPDTHSIWWDPLLSGPFVRVKGRIQVSGSQRRIHPRIHPLHSFKHTYMRIHGSSRLEKPEF